GETLVIGEINKDRLLDLQTRIRTGSYVPLEALFETDSPFAFGPAHYSTAWGVFYWFRHDDDREIQRKKRAILVEYMLACRNGFFENPGANFRKFMKGKADLTWQEHVRQRSREVFIELTIGKDGDLGKWEEVWKKWILKLDPEDPRGGLRD
ncbi:MAG: hypothetical protein JXA52_01520, partial [Planctomycetes bacterium]|nr:hypothetical protein [Planctomycetota bacterium]